MDDLISRADVFKAFANVLDCDFPYISEVTPRERIEDIPSADVVEVVRCKDCRFYKNCLIVESAQCGEMFYCGRAERRKR